MPAMCSSPSVSRAIAAFGPRSNPSGGANRSLAR
jgi:hypothetical protein